MESVFITTTVTEGLRPLGTSPQRSYELIAGTLEGTLGPEHARLFAEPVWTQYGDKVDWYAPAPGRVVPLAELDAETRADVLGRLQARMAEIRALAEAQVDQEDDAEKQRLGEALLNALEIPDESSVFAQADGAEGFRPLLVNWAWVADRQRAVRGSLSGVDTRAPGLVAGETGAAPASAAAATMASTVPDGRAGVAPVGGAGLAPALWWWLYGVGWLVLLLMLGAILLLLIAPCALRVPGLPAHCPAAGQAVAAEARYTDVLRDRVATLERQIGLADRACQPTPEVPAYLPRRAEAVPRIEGALDRAAIGARLDRSGAQIGDLTFSLIWDGPDDLDLQIVCPTGDRLFWGARSVCRGTLDIDANVRTLEPEPVENAFFNDPPTGAYEVRVILHTSRRDGAPQPFQLVVREDGRMTVHDGVVSGRASQWSHTHRQGQN